MIHIENIWDVVTDPGWDFSLNFQSGRIPMAHVYDCRNEQWVRVTKINIRSFKVSVVEGTLLMQTTICPPLRILFYGKGGEDTLLIADESGYYVHSQKNQKSFMWK